MMLQSAAKKIFETQHHGQDTTKHKSNATVISNSIPNALKSSLDCIARKILYLNDALIHSSAFDISWVRVRGDDRRQN